MFLKLSIGLYFLQIALRPWQRYTVFAVMVISTAFSMAMILFVVLQCGSFVGISQFVANRLAGKCVSSQVLLGMIYAHGGVTALTDWTFVAVPLFIVHGTNMATREKAAAGSLLAFGSAGAIASIVRFLYIPSLIVPITSYFTQSAPISIWSGLEPGIGIIAGSVVCLRPMLRHHLGWFVHRDREADPRPRMRHLPTNVIRPLPPTRSVDSNIKSVYEAQLDWLDASTLSDKESDDPLQWPLSSCESDRGSVARLQMDPRPLTQAKRPRTFSDGLPLEVFGITRSMYRSSGI